MLDMFRMWDKPSPLVIMDVGCSVLKYPSDDKQAFPAWFDRHLNIYVSRNNVVGLDLCRHDNDVVGDALAMPFREGVADYVVCRQFLEHVDAQLLIREIHRVLKLKGRLLLTTPNCLHIFNVLRALHGRECEPHPEHIQVFSAGELRNLLMRNGFDVLQLSYYNMPSEHPIRVVNAFKKAVEAACKLLFPLFCRTIRVVARKNSRGFVRYE